MSHARPRQNLKYLSAESRTMLFNKITAYLASPADPVRMHVEHFNSAHGGVRFLLWHRNFLGGFDDWQRQDALTTQTEFVPLAFWNPGDAIPPEFYYPGRNPDIAPFLLPPALATREGLTANTDVEEFVNDLEDDYHDPIHGAIGGIMEGERSPTDPIFWVLHAFFDHIAANWESIHGDLRDGSPGPGMQPQRVAAISILDSHEGGFVIPSA